MNFFRILLAPWMAAPRSSRWLAVSVLALMVAGVALGRTLAPAQHELAFSAAMLVTTNAVFWLLLMPNGLLLTLAARQLRLPGVSRDVEWSLFLYGALWIGVPMLFQFPQGHVSGFAVLQLLAATGAMLFMVMPAYLWLTLYLVFLIFHRALSHVIPMPGLFDARFVPWAGTLAVALVLVLAWRWRRLQRGEYPRKGWLAPNLINLRLGRSASSSDPLADASLIRARPNWLLARPDLRGVGPRAPGKSLRTALGGVYLPQTIMGRLCQWVPVVLFVAAFGLIYFALTLDDQGFSRALHYIFSRNGFRALSWVFAVFSLAVVMMPVELLTLRWSRPNAELPLLMLLPGLNPAQRGKSALLHAAIGLPGIRLGLLLAVGWIGAASVGSGWSVGPLMLVIALGCLGYLLAMVLSVLGGSPLPGLAKVVLMIGLSALMGLSMLLPQIWNDWSTRSVAQAEGVLAAGWIVIALVLFWLARRGWQGLQRRPHPFLPN